MLGVIALDYLLAPPTHPVGVAVAGAIVLGIAVASTLESHVRGWSEELQWASSWWLYFAWSAPVAAALLAGPLLSASSEYHARIASGREWHGLQPSACVTLVVPIAACHVLLSVALTASVHGRECVLPACVGAATRHGARIAACVCISLVPSVVVMATGCTTPYAVAAEIGFPMAGFACAITTVFAEAIDSEWGSAVGRSLVVVAVGALHAATVFAVAFVWSSAVGPTGATAERTQCGVVIYLACHGTTVVWVVLAARIHHRRSRALVEDACRE
jgi:hypothetical protein